MVSLAGEGRKQLWGLWGGGVGSASSGPGDPFLSPYEGRAEVGGSPGPKPVTMVQAPLWQQG